MEDFRGNVLDIRARVDTPRNERVDALEILFVKVDEAGWVLLRRLDEKPLVGFLGLGPQESLRENAFSITLTGENVKGYAVWLNQWLGRMRGARTGKPVRQTAEASSRTPQEGGLRARRIVDTQPSTCAGHDISCPYEAERGRGAAIP